MSDTNGRNQPPEHREFGAGRGKLRNGLVIGAFISTVGLFSLLFADDDLPDAEVIGVALVFGGIAFCWWVWKTSQTGKAILILTPEGIRFDPWGEVTVPWRLIGSVYARGGRLKRMLCLELENSEASLASLPAKERTQLERSTMTRLPLLFIPYGAVDAPPADLADLIKDYLEYSRGDARRN